LQSSLIASPLQPRDVLRVDFSVATPEAAIHGRTPINRTLRGMDLLDP
jgi:hypothetical protein